MGLSNTATPRYYGEFRKAVLRGEIPVNEQISLQMNRIDERIANRNMYYDSEAVEGYIKFCEKELTLTDGTEFHMLDSFKLWAEDVYGWYYFIERSVYQPGKNGSSGHFVTKRIKKRLTNKQFLIIGRGAAKSVYDETVQAFNLTVDTQTTSQITTAPTMRQADEVMAPFRTAITRAPGPLFKFMTAGSIHSTSSVDGVKLASTKKGIQNFFTNSILEVKPMSIDKLQGMRCQVATVDEWLSGDVREDVIGAIEQGASKNEDYLIIATSSEGTVRNGPGDSIKMELMKILKGEYLAPHVSIWWYRLDDVKEVGDPAMWAKANPNLGKTVTYDVYQKDVERAEQNPSVRNDILAKRFGLPMEGYTYFFTYEETLPQAKRKYWGMPCSMGGDLSQGDDFCAFTFMFPLSDGSFGVKVRSYITERTLYRLPLAMRSKYEDFISEGSLMVFDGSVLDMDNVFDDLDRHIIDNEYDVRSFGFDPYNAQYFVERWCKENTQMGVEKVIQGAKTESVPLGEIKKMAHDRCLRFDEMLMSYCMGNAIVLEDTNGNRKLSKKRYEHKIDNVSALVDAYVAFKLHKDDFE